MIGSRYLWNQARRYSEMIERVLADNIAELEMSNADIRELLETPELEMEHRFAHGAEHVSEVVEVFPDVLRRSAFLASFFVLESSLGSVCDLIQRRRDLPIGVSELRGSGLRRQVKYIRVVAGVDLTDFPSWAALVRRQELRNLLVHENGSMPSERLESPLGDFIRSQHPRLLLVSQGGSVSVVSVGAGFVRETIDVFEEFFDFVPVSLRI